MSELGFGNTDKRKVDTINDDTQALDVPRMKVKTYIIVISCPLLTS